MRTILIAGLILMCAGCANEQNVTDNQGAEPNVVRASRFVYDSKAKPAVVNSGVYIYDKNAPVIRAQSFAVSGG